MLVPMLGHMRVLLVDHPNLMRDSLEALLGMEVGVEVVGAVLASTSAVRLATAPRPDVVIVDFASSGSGETVAAIYHRWPSARVLVLTSSADERLLDTALRAGVNGYLLRSDTRSELMTALRRVAEGHRYISRSIRRRIAAADPGASAPPAGSDGFTLLTEREREIMQCVASGLRTREIAERLSLSHKTVEKHRSNLMRKLGLRSAAAVAAFAITKGYGRAS